MNDVLLKLKRNRIKTAEEESGNCEDELCVMGSEAGRKKKRGEKRAVAVDRILSGL